MELKDKVVVVTGARGVLGRAVCEAATAAGARVVGVDVSAGDGGPDALALDLADAQATQQALAAVAARHGRIDALVNIAGGFKWEKVADGSIDTFDAMYGLNLRTAVNACRGALPHLAAGGCIVNIGAAGAAKGGLGMAAYAASKSGVARLTESLAEELKKQDITVNAVLPSIIDTPRNRADIPKADFSKWVTPQALADVIVFLLGPRARAITGALIPVTGRV